MLELVSSIQTQTMFTVSDVFNFVKGFGTGVSHPHDEFYKEGNDACQSLKPFVICDFDEEDFYHQPYPEFYCHIPGCERTFDTVIQYESHYNSCHSFTCKECNKNLPNFHLLDLHISERHDSFFKEQAKRKPMFKCFLEECKDCFENPNQRRDHCIKVHKFPSDFRFDSAKKKGRSKKNAKKVSAGEKMDTVLDDDCDSKMDTSEEKSKEKVKSKNFKGFSFGRVHGGRKPVLHNFTKDMMNALPDK